MRRRISIWPGAMLIGLALGLCGVLAEKAPAQNPAYGGTLIVTLSAEPPGLDPTTSPAATIKRVVHYNLFEGLLKVDRSGKVVPALAKTYTVSKDGKEYTFTLHPGIKFHDGRPCTAEDVKISLERIDSIFRLRDASLSGR